MFWPVASEQVRELIFFILNTELDTGKFRLKIHKDFCPNYQYILIQGVNGACL